MSPTTFADLPQASIGSLEGASVAVFGASEASPYKTEKPSHSANAPEALREASATFAGQLRQFDFDLEGALFGANGETWGMVDLGTFPLIGTTLQVIASKSLIPRVRC